MSSQADPEAEEILRAAARHLGDAVVSALDHDVVGAGDVERLQLQLDIVGEIILRRQVDVCRAANLAVGAAVRLVIARAVTKIGAQREAPFFEPDRSAGGPFRTPEQIQLGRASCGERGCQYVY